MKKDVLKLIFYRKVNFFLIQQVYLKINAKKFDPAYKFKAVMYYK